jgi:GNAT superfamily N-acetyltransferase
MKHEKTEVLKDGTKVLFRNLTEADLDSLMDFFQGLPEEDRNYLRVDVTDRNVVASRLKLIKDGTVSRIAAIDKGRIVASGALEIFPDAWKKHQAELRVIVSQPYRRKGLGMLMMRELYLLAAGKKIELLVARLMRPQGPARKICRALGFREELVVPDYVRDMTGATQDMVIMAIDMPEFWKELEHFYQLSDWQQSR